MAKRASEALYLEQFGKYLKTFIVRLCPAV